MEMDCFYRNEMFLFRDNISFEMFFFPNQNQVFFLIERKCKYVFFFFTE